MQNNTFSKNDENLTQNTQKTLKNNEFSHDFGGKQSQKASPTLCPKCGTSVTEILETGFVGCEKCYDLPAVKNAIDKMFGGKKHKC